MKLNKFNLLRLTHNLCVPYLLLAKHRVICGVKVFDTKLRPEFAGMLLLPHFANKAVLIDQNNVCPEMGYDATLFHEIIHSTQNIMSALQFDMELEAYAYQYLYLVEDREDMEKLYDLMWEGLRFFARAGHVYGHTHTTNELFKIACNSETHDSRFSKLWELSRQFRKELGLD